MSDESAWLEYRIFIRKYLSPAEDYALLLKQAIAPLVSQFEPQIRQFHFLRYQGLYGSASEPVDQRLFFADSDPVHFLRLRMEVAANAVEEIEAQARELSVQANIGLGLEKPLAACDVQPDLARQFGATRVPLVLRFLESASRLALVYATDGEPYDPDPGGDGGVAGILHLAANTLSYDLYGGAQQDWHRLRPLGPRLGP